MFVGVRLLIRDRNTIETKINNKRHSSIVHDPPVVDRMTLREGLGLVIISWLTSFLTF